MLGYGAAPKPSASWCLAEEVDYLVRMINQQDFGRLHLVTHSLGTFFGLHLRLALRERVSRLTIVDPLLISVLREFDESAALAETESVYQAFLKCLPDTAAAARLFVNYWNGEGAWDSIGGRARAVIAALVPKVGLEMSSARADVTPLEALAISAPPTTVLCGEKTKLAPRAVAAHVGGAFNASLVEVPGAGHMIPLTHPDAVVSAALQ
jgi:pimeloyl-ACP methyl ester carboxylesterase